MLVGFHEFQNNMTAPGACRGDCSLCDQPGSQGDRKQPGISNPRAHSHDLLSPANHHLLQFQNIPN